MWSREVLDVLGAVAMVANTPAFVFGRYRQVPEIRRIAESHSADELVAMLCDLDIGAHLFDDVVSAWGLATALSFRPSAEVVEALHGKPAWNIEWLRELLVRAASQSNAIPHNLIEVAGGKPSIVEQMPSPSGNTRILIES